MKKIILLTFFLTITINSVAQRGNREKIKALKTAYITEQLDLSPKEAEQFWPIYNEFSKKEKNYRTQDLRLIKKKIQNAGGIDSFSEKDANKLLNEVLTIENNIHIAKEKLVKDLKSVISVKKILKLLRAEKEFNRKLLKRIKGQMNNRKPR